jgi:hypothetical protein
MLALMEGVMADMLKHHPDRPMIDASLFIVEPPLPVVFDKKAIKAALDILKPKLAEREDCLEDVRYAFESVQNADEQHELFSPPSKETKRAYGKVLAALKRVKAAQQQLPRFELLLLKKICDLEMGIKFCEYKKDQWEQMPARKPHPPSHKQRRAVSWAYNLVELWLVRKKGIDDADSLSRESPWHKLSAILFGKKVDLLAHMSRHQKNLTGLNATIAEAKRSKARVANRGRN